MLVWHNLSCVLGTTHQKCSKCFQDVALLSLLAGFCLFALHLPSLGIFCPKLNYPRSAQALAPVSSSLGCHPCLSPILMSMYPVRCGRDSASVIGLPYFCLIFHHSNAVLQTDTGNHLGFTSALTCGYSDSGRSSS